MKNQIFTGTKYIYFTDREERRQSDKQQQYVGSSVFSFFKPTRKYTTLYTIYRTIHKLTI